MSVRSEHGRAPAFKQMRRHIPIESALRRSGAASPSVWRAPLTVGRGHKELTVRRCWFGGTTAEGAGGSRWGRAAGSQIKTALKRHQADRQQGRLPDKSGLAALQSSKIRDADFQINVDLAGVSASTSETRAPLHPSTTKKTYVGDRAFCFRDEASPLGGVDGTSGSPIDRRGLGRRKAARA